MAENWKPIGGYEDAYEVSDLGRVRSLSREVFAGCMVRKFRQITRRTFPGDKGEPRLFLSADGRRKVFYVSALVLEAFVGPRPEGMEARHRSNDLTDNSLANLFWGPQASGPKKDQGLTPLQHNIIALQGHESCRKTAKTFGVDPSVVRRLWARANSAAMREVSSITGGK